MSHKTLNPGKSINIPCRLTIFKLNTQNNSRLYAFQPVERLPYTTNHKVFSNILDIEKPNK